MVNVNYQGFPNSCTAGEVIGKFTDEDFLPGEGNLMRSDFDDLNLFQS